MKTYEHHSSIHGTALWKRQNLQNCLYSCFYLSIKSIRNCSTSVSCPVAAAAAAAAAATATTVAAHELLNSPFSIYLRN
ncbi:hypothetical protein F0562_030794 [Nyssa sinensis]|uniref:Uncharacterized protein n=1 Tax=Nyssa sinensis TaxID=561372 RepID=A0A5J5B1L4_9ASTE|nr:hypothetical protein F0562_030794 [Nyssa sinensis]